MGDLQTTALLVVDTDVLIEYLAKQPYQDVANGIEFLRNAPVVDVNLTINNPEQSAMNTAE